MKSKLQSVSDKKTRRVGLLIACALVFSALGQDVTTSFEFNDRDGAFTLGTPPKTVTFERFEAKTVGQFSLYRSGLNSAMVAAGQTGTIVFETPAAEVRFFLKDQTTAVQSVLRFLGESGQVIQTVDGTLAAAPALVFPQFANGEAGGLANRTRLVLRPTSNAPVSGQVRFADNEGNPVQVPVGGQLISTVDFSLASFGTFDLRTDGTGPLTTGIVEVVPDSGDLSQLEGTVIFEILGNFVSVQAGPVRTAHQVYVSFNAEESTGAALFNPDPSNPASLQVVLLDSQGQTQASGTVVLQPREQEVAFVDEAAFFPEFFAGRGEFEGTLNISVTQGPGIAATGLLQRRSNGALIAVATSGNAFIP